MTTITRTRDVPEHIRDKFEPFYGGIYSQWLPCTFEIDGTRYNCAEQYMMHQKANLFGDYRIASNIMETDNPADQKAMGKQVAGFDKDVWERDAKLIVYRGNLAKFGQNGGLRRELLRTGGRIIVEASPTDTIWGIGIGIGEADVFYPARWKGTNWLGDVLMKVRSDLRTMTKCGVLRP